MYLNNGWPLDEIARLQALTPIDGRYLKIFLLGPVDVPSPSKQAR
jgi:hypothetical protein